MKDLNVKTTFNKQRRRVLQGAGALAATAVLPSAVGAGNTAGSITGTVVSKIGHPVKSLILRNDSNSTVNIHEFANGGLMFDGEVFDCNGACIDGPVSLAPGQEKLIQFDKRRLFSKSPEKVALTNIQSAVTRLQEGTRVVPFTASFSHGVAIV